MDAPVGRVGPDAARYWLAAGGHRQVRPFHLRWLLPWVCGQDVRRWWAVWLVSWPVAAAALFAWQVGPLGWQRAAAAVVLLLALPGVLGPPAVIPVGVDLPATALTLTAVACLADGRPVAVAAGGVAIGVAAGVKEQAPVWAALWLWSPLPLFGLLVPVVVHVVRRPADTDPLGERFTNIANHPVRTALEAHAGRWRDGRLMVAPWGVCLAGLVSPTPQTFVALVAAYGLLLVATDTVRLVHHAAGPVLAVAAVQVVPVEWLLLACVAHVVWWWTPERV